MTPDDFGAGWAFVENIFKVIAGLVVGGWASLKLAGKLGGKQREYEELREDVTVLQNSKFITKEQHDALQTQCQSEIKRMVDNQVHSAMAEVKDQLSDIKGTMCYFMGRMGIDPPDEGAIKHRRRNDKTPPVL